MSKVAPSRIGASSSTSASSSGSAVSAARTAGSSSRVRTVKTVEAATAAAAASNGRPAAAASSTPASDAWLLRVALEKQSAAAAAAAAAATVSASSASASAAQKNGKRRRKQPAMDDAAAPASAQPVSAAAAASSASSSSAAAGNGKTVLAPVVLKTERGKHITIEPALHYLHLLARNPTLHNVHLQKRYQREVLSWREMPEEFKAAAPSVSSRSHKKRSRNGDTAHPAFSATPTAAAAFSAARAAPSSSSFSSASSDPPLALPSPARPVPAAIPGEFVSPFESSGLLIHPSLVAASSPAPAPSFPHLLDPLLLPPPLPRRRKPVERCSSPSHFLLTPASLTAYGPDYHIDLPLRERMDELLLACLAQFFTPRLVMAEDSGKVWEDLDAATGGGGRAAAYSSVERVMSPLRRRRCRERWTLREIATFELGICMHGKDFHRIAKMLTTKSTSETVEFYYTTWKRSLHYDVWKNRPNAITAPRQQQQPQQSTQTAAAAIASSPRSSSSSRPLRFTPSPSSASIQPSSSSEIVVIEEEAASAASPSSAVSPSPPSESSPWPFPQPAPAPVASSAALAAVLPPPPVPVISLPDDSTLSLAAIARALKMDEPSTADIAANHSALVNGVE